MKLWKYKKRNQQRVSNKPRKYSSHFNNGYYYENLCYNGIEQTIRMKDCTTFAFQIGYHMDKSEMTKSAILLQSYSVNHTGLQKNTEPQLEILWASWMPWLEDFSSPFYGSIHIDDYKVSKVTSNRNPIYWKWVKIFSLQWDAKDWASS